MKLPKLKTEKLKVLTVPQTTQVAGGLSCCDRVTKAC